MSSHFTIRRILLLVFGGFTLLLALQASQAVYEEWRRLGPVKSLKEVARLSDTLFDATEKLAIERDVSTALLHTVDIESTQSLIVRLQESREQTNKSIQTTLQTFRTYEFPALAPLHNKVMTRFADIQRLRAEIDHALTQPIEARDPKLAASLYEEITILMSDIESLWTNFIGYFTDINPRVTQHLRFKHLMRIISNYMARERAIISKLIVENVDPTPEEFSDLLYGRGVMEASWNMSLILATQSGLYPVIGSAYTDAKSHYQNLHDMMHDIFYMPGAKHGKNYPISADLWLELSTQVIDSMDSLKKVSREESARFIEQLEHEAWRHIIAQICFLFIVLLLCAYSFRVLTQRVLTPIQQMIDALLAAMRGETPNILPPVDYGDEISKLGQVLHAFQHSTNALKEYMQALERSNKELDDFAYIASHDLKEPLRGIHNHARFLLEDNEGKLDDESVKKLHRLTYLSRRMERLVTDLLYFSRLGRQELAIQETDINDVIRDIDNTLDIFLTEHNAQILLPSPLPTITCDSTRVTELFRNLITNAVKYNDSEIKIIEIGFLKQFISPQFGTLKDVFYVKDNGRGIAPEFNEEVFRIFKRLQSAKEGEEGTGVGLTFVKKIVERHGGHIWLESKPGRGTTFYFTLNVASVVQSNP